MKQFDAYKKSAIQPPKSTATSSKGQFQAPPPKGPAPKAPAPSLARDDSALKSGAARISSAKTTILPNLDIEALLKSAPTTPNAAKPAAKAPAAPKPKPIKLAPIKLAPVKAVAKAFTTAVAGPSKDRQFASRRSAFLDTVQSWLATQGGGKTLPDAKGDSQSRNGLILDAVARLTACSDAGSNNAQTLADLATIFERDPALFGDIMADIGGSLDAPKVVDNALSAPDVRGRMFQEVVGHLARPESVSQGQGTVTCGASVAQVLLINVDPRAYYSLVRDLIVVGAHNTAGGGTLYFPRDLPRRNGRTLLDSVVQDLLFNEAIKFRRSGEPTGGISGASQNQSQASRPAGDRPRGRNSGSGGAQYGADDNTGGLYTGQIQRLIERLTGRPWVWEDVTDASSGHRAEVFAAIKSLITGDPRFLAEAQRRQDPADRTEDKGPLAQGSGDARTRPWGVPVGIYTQAGTFHEVLIQDFDRKTGEVLYYDPATGRQERCDERTFFNSVCQVMVSVSAPSKIDPLFNVLKDRGQSGNAMAALGQNRTAK